MSRYIFVFVLFVNIGLLQAQYTAIPDSVFEQNLIDQGIDTEGVLDGFVLTADIEFITELTLYNEIVSLQGIEDFQSLEDLNIGECFIYFLDLTQNIALKKLDCRTSMLFELDLSQNINLEWVNCSDGIISELDLNNAPNLTFISCEGNNISNLDLSNKPYLESVHCSSNPLTYLDITNTPNLKFLSTGGTELTTLDVLGNPLLEYLDCVSNNINLLNVENNQVLKELYCSNNSIQELNVNNSPFLERLRCENNDLHTLYIQNGANELLTGTYMSGSNEVQRFNSLNNPNLTCIFVDDTTYCEENWVDYDPTSHFVETQAQCDAIGIDEVLLANGLKFYPNPVNDVLQIENLSFSSIENIIITNSLGQICKETNNTVIDLSNLPKGFYIVNIAFFEGNILTYKILKE